MNINIIEECNNDCFFCFQGKCKGNKSFNINQIDEVLNWYNHFTNTIGIIGGEPTLNKDFIEICKLCVNKGYCVEVFTNLICKEKIVEDMLDIPNLNFLINICHNDSLDEKFNKNYQIITQRDLNRAWDLNSAVFLGITITGDKEYDDKNINRLYSLLRKDNNRVIKGVRMSQAIPYDNDYKLNYSFGDTVIEIITNCKQINPLLIFNFDCAVNLCIFGEENYNKLKNMSNVLGLKLTCDSPVLDISPSYTTKWCACCDKEYNIKDYQNVHLLYNQMCKDYYLNSKKNILCDYSNCTKLECRGLCNGIANAIINNKK